MHRPPLSAACLLLLAVLTAFSGCGGDQVAQTEKPIAEATYNKILQNLGQAEFVKLATHFRNREQVATYMKEKADTFTLMGSLDENGMTYDDYNLSNKAVAAGLTVVFDTETGLLKEVGAGLSPALASAVEELLPAAVFSQDEKSEPPFLSKKTYYFGYLPVGGAKLDITFEKTTLPDKALFSIIYKLKGDAAGPK